MQIKGGREDIKDQFAGMVLRICLIVDSNLNSVRLGKTCPKVKPYIRCDGRIYCPNTVVEPGDRQMPTVAEIQEQRFTDVVIALGMNHCRYGGENQGKAIGDLYHLFKVYSQASPGVRFYHVLVPPSLSERINDNITRFNNTMSEMLTSIKGLTTVRVPRALYAHSGLLSIAYARLNETVAGYPDDEKLHLNEDGKSMVVYCILRAVGKAANKRI